METPPSESTPVCLACGACCHSRLEAYVRVTGEDWTRLGADADRVAHFIGHRAFLRMADGHCAALRVVRDEAGRPREFFCTIYDRRPQVCRDLGRGTPSCEAERELKAAAAAGGRLRPTPSRPDPPPARPAASG